jgi:hypothetical protein
VRRLILLACAVVLSAALVGAARGADEAGSLSVERGRGIVTLEVRGNVLGRLTNGTITVTDRTPNDPYIANITGKRLVVQRRLSATKVYVRGQGLRFRMLGGSYRIVIRGNGVSLTAIGRGSVSIDGEPRFVGDDLGVYSIEADVDCSMEPLNCTPVPDEPIRLKLAKVPAEEPSVKGEGAR